MVSTHQNVWDLSEFPVLFRWKIGSRNSAWGHWEDGRGKFCFQCVLCSGFLQRKFSLFNPIHCTRICDGVPLEAKPLHLHLKPVGHGVQALWLIRVLFLVFSVRHQRTKNGESRLKDEGRSRWCEGKLLKLAFRVVCSPFCSGKMCLLAKKKPTKRNVFRTKIKSWSSFVGLRRPFFWMKNVMVLSTALVVSPWKDFFHISSGFGSLTNVKGFCEEPRTFPVANGQTWLLAKQKLKLKRSHYLRVLWSQTLFLCLLKNASPFPVLNPWDRRLHLFSLRDEEKRHKLQMVMLPQFGTV